VVAYIRDVRDREFEIGQKALAKGLTFYEVPERGKFDLRVLPALRDIIERHDINVIHSHDYKSDLFAYLLRRWICRRHIALMSTAHAWVMLGPKGELYRRLDLFLMKRFDRLIAVSHATKSEMVNGGVPANKITVLHNGIDTDAWSRAGVKTTLRDELQLLDAFPVIGYVGRITPEKDLETWLRAAAILAEKFPRARFLLVGDGKENNAQQGLDNLAKTLGIRDNVIFAGYRRQLLPVYAAFDVFFLSSRREGLPNSLLEAMAMRLPVVTSDVAGARELVVDGETGFVLPQGDVRGMAEALLNLANRGEVRMRLAQAGRERVEKEFSFAHRLQKIEEIYERLTDRTANLPPSSREPKAVSDEASLV
jgi:glycosyltransferase involved in cell wall biosynthesis